MILFVQTSLVRLYNENKTIFCQTFMTERVLFSFILSHNLDVVCSSIISLSSLCQWR